MKFVSAARGCKLPVIKLFVLSSLLLTLLSGLAQARPVAHILPPSTKYAAKWDPMVAATAMRLLSINLASRHDKWIKYWPAWQENQITEQDYPRISISGSGKIDLAGQHTIHVHFQKNKDAKPQEIASVNVSWASYDELRQSILNLHKATLKAVASKLSLDLSNPKPPQHLPTNISRSIHRYAMACFPGERFTCYRALKKISTHLDRYPASPDLFALAAMGTAIQMRWQTFDYIHVGRTQAIPASYILMAELLAGKAADKYKLAQAWTAWSSGYPTHAKGLHKALSAAEKSTPPARAVYMLSTTDYRNYSSGSVLENIAWAIALRRSNYCEQGQISDRLSQQQGKCEYSEYASHVAFAKDSASTDTDQLKLITPKLIAHYNHILARLSRDYLLDTNIPKIDRRTVANEILREMKLKPAPSGKIDDDAKQIAKTAMASTKWLNNDAARSIALCLVTANEYPAGPIVGDAPIRWQVLSPADFAQITRKELSRIVRRLWSAAIKPKAKELVADRFLEAFANDYKLAYMFDLLKACCTKNIYRQKMLHAGLPPQQRHLKWAHVDLILEKQPPTFNVAKLPAPRGAYEWIAYYLIFRKTDNPKKALKTQPYALAANHHCLINAFGQNSDKYSYDLAFYKDVFKYVDLNPWAKPIFPWLAKLAIYHSDKPNFRDGYIRSLEKCSEMDNSKLYYAWWVLNPLGQYERMEKFINKAKQKAELDNDSTCSLLMKAMYLQGKYEALLKEYPPNCETAGANIMKALALEKLGRLDEAEKAFRTAARSQQSCKGKYTKNLVGFMIRHKYPPAKILKAVDEYGIMNIHCESCRDELLYKFRIWPGYKEALIDICVKHTKTLKWRDRDKALYRTMNTDRLAKLTEACKPLPEYSRQFFDAKNWKITRGILNTKSSLISWDDDIPFKAVMFSSRPDMHFQPKLPDEFVMHFYLAKQGRLRVSLAKDDKLTLGNYDDDWSGYTSSSWGPELKSHSSSKHYRDNSKTCPVLVIWQKKTVEIWMSGMLVFRGSKAPKIKPGLRINWPEEMEWGKNSVMLIADFKVYALTKSAAPILKKLIRY